MLRYIGEKMKMKNYYILIAILLLSNGILYSQTNEWKTFQIGKYKIEFPSNFSFIEEQGLDSYIGKIESNELVVEFDYGAFTNNLEEYENNPDYEVKINNLEGDYRKIVYSKISSDGFTAIYLLDENTSIALGMYASNISSENQSLLLDIFENRISQMNLSTKNYLTQISFNLNNHNNFIELKGISKAENFIIYNFLGSKILNGEIENKGKISIDYLKKGIYFFRLENGYINKFLKY